MPSHAYLVHLVFSRALLDKTLAPLALKEHLNQTREALFVILVVLEHIHPQLRPPRVLCATLALSKVEPDKSHVIYVWLENTLRSMVIRVVMIAHLHTIQFKVNVNVNWLHFITS